MKLFNQLFLMLAITVMFTSCGDDEMSSVTTDAALAGTWQTVSFNTDTDATQTAAGTTQTSNNVSTGSNILYDVTFNSGSFSAMGSYDIQTVVSVGGNVLLTQNDSFTDIEGSGTFTTSNGKISIMGALFDVTVDGSQSSPDALEVQEYNYEINDNGQLIISGTNTFMLSQTGATLTGSSELYAVFEKL